MTTAGPKPRVMVARPPRICCCPVELDSSGDARVVSGPTAGEVCCQVTGVERITSTISFHLKELRLAGLITVERRGKNMICGVRHDALEALAGYLNELEKGNTNDCCK